MCLLCGGSVIGNVAQTFLHQRLQLIIGQFCMIGEQVFFGFEYFIHLLISALRPSRFSAYYLVQYDPEAPHVTFRRINYFILILILKLVRLLPKEFVLDLGCSVLPCKVLHLGWLSQGRQSDTHVA